MFNIHNYKIKFNIWGLAVFIMIMIPNLIWFVVPSSNDVLRIESITPTIDIIASISQVVMVIGLCFLSNYKKTKTINNKIKASIVTTIIFYFLGWILYYFGYASHFIILDLCIMPSIVFILFLLAYQNYITLIPATVFTIGHLIFCIVNFII